MFIFWNCYTKKAKMREKKSSYNKIPYGPYGPFMDLGGRGSSQSVEDQESPGAPAEEGQI